MAPTAPFRLDAAESVFFARELEDIDRRMFQTIFADLRALQYIPLIPGISPYQAVYTWRMFTMFGQAVIVDDTADDIPAADVTGDEESRIIKTVGSAYSYNIFDIQRAAAVGTPLDQMKADAARFAINTKVDQILALGDAPHNLVGLLSIPSGTTSYSPNTKSLGGTTWVNGTPDEVAKDIHGIAAAVRVAMKNSGGPMFNDLTVLVPDAQHAQIATTRMGDGSDSTILRHVLTTSPWIKAIEPWHLCATAGAGSTARMVCYPRTELVVGAVLPIPYASQPPQQRNLNFVINAIARCGGIVPRYPIAIAYGDGI